VTLVTFAPMREPYGRAMRRIAHAVVALIPCGQRFNGVRERETDNERREGRCPSPLTGPETRTDRVAAAEVEVRPPSAKSGALSATHLRLPIPGGGSGQCPGSMTPAGARSIYSNCKSHV